MFCNTFGKSILENKTSYCNIPDFVANKIGRNLHNQEEHPIKIIKEYIYNYFKSIDDRKFETFDNFSPFVTVQNNFDYLLIPHNHSSRSKSDSYYLNETIVLRTHTSAHQNELLEKGHRSFLVTGDVYRKDEVDMRHFYCFHQMEGVHLVDENEDPETDLKKTLSGLIEYLFPQNEYRFGKDHFPFTNPSFEIEVKFGDKWLEVLGCGVIHSDILNRFDIKQKGWAFGLGLERFAMILFNIQDIRLFWTDNVRFLKQFKNEEIVSFQPYSKVDPMKKDISFWIDKKEILIKEPDFEWININDFYELVREVCGESIESVFLLDKFYHKKYDKYSITFRLLIGAENYTQTNNAEVTIYANKCLRKVVEKVESKGYIVR